MVSDRTIPTQSPPGRKSQKDCVKVLVCYNADGSENFEFMFIEKEKRLCPFYIKFGHYYRLNYSFNLEDWMTSHLCFEFLHRFDNFIVRTLNRK